MSEQENTSSEGAIAKVVVPADMSVAQVVSVHADALKVFDAVEGSIHLELDGDEPTICALQILVSAKRSAEAKSLSISLSDSAQSVFEKIDMV